MRLPGRCLLLEDQAHPRERLLEATAGVLWALPTCLSSVGSAVCPVAVCVTAGTTQHAGWSPLKSTVPGAGLGGSDTTALRLPA